MGLCNSARFTLSGFLLAWTLGAPAHEDELIPSGAPDKLGEVNFPISCSAAAQIEFNRAMAMLHSFFYPEAGRTFAKAAELDPSCAMAHWGSAMSWWYPLWFPPARESLLLGKAELDKAVAVGAKTERERAYINALTLFYGDFEKADHTARSLAYERAMAKLHDAYPNDTEAAALYALALQSTADPNDKSYPNQLRSAAILEKLFVQTPHHPGVAHYLIHAYDYPELAPRALGAARSYGKIAPAMPHALHMPSHTFIALGLWRESIESNLAAGVEARRLGWKQEELHTMDYLVYAYLQLGESESAKAVLARLPKATRAGALPQAETEIAQLTHLRDKLLQAKQDYWAKQVDIQRQAGEAWITWSQGDAQQALAIMRGAADLEESTYKHPVTPGQLLPARELLGDLLLQVDRGGEALTEYETALRLTPNRFNALYGAACAAELSGERDKAARYFQMLLDMAATADPERQEIRYAKTFLSTTSAHSSRSCSEQSKGVK